MAQHSKPFYWLKTLAANSQIANCRETKSRDLEPVPERSRRSVPLAGLLSLAGGLAAISCTLLSTSASAATVFIVEVLSNSEDVLEVVRTEVSDAYIVTKEDGTQSIIAGTFVDEANARRQASALHALNVSPTSISPFEYTPEDEAGDENNTDDVAAADSSEPATTEFIASSATPPSTDAPSPAAPPEATPPSAEPQTTAAAPQVSQSSAPGGGGSDIPPDSDRLYSTLVTIPNGTQPETALADVQHFFPAASLQPYNNSQAIQTGTFSHRSQAQLQAEWLQTKGLHAIAIPTDTLNPSSSTVASTPSTASAPPAAASAPPTADIPTQPEGVQAATPQSPAQTGTSQAPPSAPVAAAPTVATPPADSLTSIAPTAESPQPSASQASEAQADVPADTPQVAAATAPPSALSGYWVLVADPVGGQFADIKAIVPGAQAMLYNQQQVVRTGAFASEAEAMEQVRYLSTQGYEAGIFTAVDEPANNQAAQPAAE